MKIIITEGFKLCLKITEYLKLTTVEKNSQ